MSTGPTSSVTNSLPSPKATESASLSVGLPNIGATDSVAFPSLPKEQRLTPEEKRDLLDKISARIKELEAAIAPLKALMGK